LTGHGSGGYRGRLYEHFTPPPDVPKTHPFCFEFGNRATWGAGQYNISVIVMPLLLFLLL